MFVFMNVTVNIFGGSCQGAGRNNNGISVAYYAPLYSAVPAKTVFAHGICEAELAPVRGDHLVGRGDQSQRNAEPKYLGGS